MAGEDGQDEDVTELLRPGADSPAESGNERQHTGVEENVQLEKKGEGFSTARGLPNARAAPAIFCPAPSIALIG